MGLVTSLGRTAGNVVRSTASRTAAIIDARAAGDDVALHAAVRRARTRFTLVKPFTLIVNGMLRTLTEEKATDDGADGVRVDAVQDDAVQDDAADADRTLRRRALLDEVRLDDDVRAAAYAALKIGDGKAPRVSRARLAGALADLALGVTRNAVVREGGPASAVPRLVAETVEVFGDASAESLGDLGETALAGRRTAILALTALVRRDPTTARRFIDESAAPATTWTALMPYLEAAYDGVLADRSITVDVEPTFPTADSGYPGSLPSFRDVGYPAANLAIAEETVRRAVGLGADARAAEVLDRLAADLAELEDEQSRSTADAGDVANG